MRKLSIFLNTTFTLLTGGFVDSPCGIFTKKVPIPNSNYCRIILLAKTWNCFGVQPVRILKLIVPSSSLTLWSKVDKPTQI